MTFPHLQYMPVLGVDSMSHFQTQPIFNHCRSRATEKTIIHLTVDRQNPSKYTPKHLANHHWRLWPHFAGIPFIHPDIKGVSTQRLSEPKPESSIRIFDFRQAHGFGTPMKHCETSWKVCFFWRSVPQKKSSQSWSHIIHFGDLAGPLAVSAAPWSWLVLVLHCFSCRIGPTAFEIFKGGPCIRKAPLALYDVHWCPWCWQAGMSAAFLHETKAHLLSTIRIKEHSADGYYDIL